MGGMRLIMMMMAASSSAADDSTTITNSESSNSNGGTTTSTTSGMSLVDRPDEIIASAVAIAIIYLIYELRRFFLRHLPRSLVVFVLYCLVLPLIYTPQLLLDSLMKVSLLKGYRDYWAPVVEVYVVQAEGSFLTRGVLLSLATAVFAKSMYKIWVPDPLNAATRKPSSFIHSAVNCGIFRGRVAQ